MIVAEPPLLQMRVLAMQEPERHDFKQIIAEIEEKLGRHTLAKMMRRQYVQIARMAETGRCQHYDGEMLLLIHGRYVVGQTLQNVSSSATPRTT